MLCDVTKFRAELLHLLSGLHHFQVLFFRGADAELQSPRSVWATAPTPPTSVTKLELVKKKTPVYDEENEQLLSRDHGEKILRKRKCVVDGS